MEIEWNRSPLKRISRKERVTREEQDEWTPSTSDKDYGNTPRGKAIVPPSPLRHNVRGSERERVTDRSRVAKSRCLSKFLCPSKRRFSRPLSRQTTVPVCVQTCKA